MKKTLVLFALIGAAAYALLFTVLSCNSEKKDEYSVAASRPFKTSQSEIGAVYRDPADGKNKVALMLRVISAVVMEDTITGAIWNKIDTTWGRPVQDTATNQTFYARIAKDSVEWRIQGVPMDSLLKNFLPRAQ